MKNRLSLRGIILARVFEGKKNYLNCTNISDFSVINQWIIFQSGVWSGSFGKWNFLEWSGSGVEFFVWSGVEFFEVEVETII